MVPAHMSSHVLVNGVAQLLVVLLAAPVRRLGEGGGVASPALSVPEEGWCHC